MSRSSSRIVKIILLVSCAHALVHLLEQSIASAEQVISEDFDLTLTQSGYLGTALRLPYGLGAFFAGLLAARFGEKRILVLYLFGAAVVCVSFLLSTNASMVYTQLLALGTFASMYHPAGLALLANETTPAERSRALGMHGVFGSLGIAAAPFLAGMMLSLRPGDWKTYYLLLGLLSGSLAVLVWLLLRPTVHTDQSPPGSTPSPASPAPPTHPPTALPTAAATTAFSADSSPFQFWPYALLVLGTALSGLVYGGVLHFLPRYLKESGALAGLQQLTGFTIPDAALGNYAAALALICGAFGQWTAGRMARPKSLPVLLATVYAANIPFLVWMTFADGWQRLIAACGWAFVHFMNQPLYNSLLPEFLPRRSRSVGFGFSNMMGFGVGAIGPPLVAQFGTQLNDYTISYSALAILIFVAAVLPLPLMQAGFADREHDRSGSSS